MDDNRMKALAEDVRATARAISRDMGWRGDMRPNNGAGRSANSIG